MGRRRDDGRWGIGVLINHLIVGCGDVETMTRFYEEFLGFRRSDDDPGAKGGRVLLHDRCELLLIPFPPEKLPNPAHFAFEIEGLNEFERLLGVAKEMGLNPRRWPRRDSERGTTDFSRGEVGYRIFYVTDPSDVTLEVMVRISE